MGVLEQLWQSIYNIGEAIMGFFGDLAELATSVYSMTANLGGVFGVIFPSTVVSALLLFVAVGILYKIVGR